ncbi:hypothetical protein Tco_0766486 [Tanacetum coccineum]
MEIYLNCTYRDGKPVTCCGCEGPLNGGFCSFCASRAGNSFAYDPNPNSFNDSQNLFDYPPQPQYQTYSCELCGNDAHYGYDCPPQVPIVYNQEPCFNQNFDNNFPQTSPNEVKRIQQILERTPFDAITPEFTITDSLSMGDEHLSTIPETESDELIKSSVENLVPTPSEPEDLSNDDESFSDEDVSKENFKIYSNPLFDEEIISNILTVSYPKIDYLLEEFSGELTHINLIPPGINKANFDPEEEIRLIEELLYDNSSPQPSEESNFKISDATIESFSPSPIPVEDSDFLMEEIDLFLNPDDSIPQGIKDDDYDSEGDILFLEELLSNDSLPKTKSFHFDHYDVPSSPRPPAKPPDDGIFFDFEPDTGVLTAKVVKDISEHYVLMPKL